MWLKALVLYAREGRRVNKPCKYARLSSFYGKVLNCTIAYKGLTVTLKSPQSRTLPSRLRTGTTGAAHEEVCTGDMIP